MALFLVIANKLFVILLFVFLIQKIGKTLNFKVYLFYICGEVLEYFEGAGLSLLYLLGSTRVLGGGRFISSIPAGEY